MRVVILDRSPHGNAADARSDELLASIVRDRGHEARIVVAGVAPSDAVVRRAAEASVVLVRADLRSPAELTAVAEMVREVERCGVPCLPSADGLLAAEDKAVTHRVLDAAGVPQVAWTEVPSPGRADARTVAEVVGGFPVAAKAPVSWGGDGVRFCADAAALGRAFAEAGDRPLVVEAWRAHDRSCTVLVAGGRAVSSYAMRRRGDDPRSNARHGGTPESWDADPVTADHAVRAVRACGLRFGSVDFVGGGDGRGGASLCLEVNAMPGLWPDDDDDRAFAAAIVDEALRAGARR